MFSPFAKFKKLIQGENDMATIQLNLNKNEVKLNLTKAAPNLKNLEAKIVWNCGVKMDLDLVSFSLNSAGQIESGDDVCYYNGKDRGFVVLPEDVRSGNNKPEKIFYKLDQIPSNKPCQALYTTIDKAIERQQTFGMLNDSFFELINKDTQEVVARYKLNTYVNDTAIHLVNIVTENGEHHVESVGLGGIIHDLSDLVDKING